MFPGVLVNVGIGVSAGYRLVKSFMLLALQPYVGLFGELEIMCASKAKL
jgi:hypothetical protein